LLKPGPGSNTLTTGKMGSSSERGLKSIPHEPSSKTLAAIEEARSSHPTS